MNILESVVFYKLIAQAYGESNYSSYEYGSPSEQGTEAGSETTQETPLAPVTGFFREQPPSVIIPVILLAAVLLGTLSFLVSRAVRNRRNK